MMKSNMPTETGVVAVSAENAAMDAHSVQKTLIEKRLKGISWRKRLAWILGIIILLAAGGIGVNKWLGSGKSSGYLTMTAAKNTITDSIEATGTLEPVKESEMGFKNDGTITVLNVQPGEIVKAGQVLAQQDPSTLQSALQQAQSSLMQDQISLQTTQLTYETNLKTLDQQQKLFQAGALAQTDLDTAKNNVTKSQWDVNTAQAKLANDQAKVEQAQSDLTGATLTAPFDGIIGVVNGQVGQINGINSSTSTLLTVMSQDLQLSALVNEADIGRIKVGQDVEFTSSAYTDKTFKGQVLRITPAASTVSNVQFYPVLISCIDPDHQLKSGMSISANVIVNRKSNVLTVPMMAVSYAQSYIKSNPVQSTPQTASSTGSGTSQAKTPVSSESASSAAAAQNEKRSMVLVMQNNQPVVKAVVLGLNDGTNYEVVSGLNEGDLVIVGSNIVDSSSSSSSSSNSSNSSSKSKQNQMGGGGMGGPPPGF